MKIASFEGLEFLFSRFRKQYYAISFSGSPVEEITRANYPPQNIIFPEWNKKMTAKEKLHFAYWASEKEVIQSTNLTRLIRAHHLGALSPDTFSSPYLERWAKRNGIQIICTPYRLQRKYENKLFFDRFLRKHHLPVPQGLILRSAEDIFRVDRFPIVLQTPNSLSSKGTFVIFSRDELTRFISVEKKASFPLLCRQLITPGVPIGVSVLIGPKRMIFSSIRAQAHFVQSNGKSTYYGTQWMKTAEVDEKVIDKLNRALQKAAREMQKKGFLGIASFDLIIRDEDVFFLECNPRTGVTSPQMVFCTELIHGVDFLEEYVRIMKGGELSIHKPFVPDSNYEGFALDLGFMADLVPEGPRLNAVRTGIYSYKPGYLEYISARVDDFYKKSHIYVHFIHPPGEWLHQRSSLGLIFTHFPLLEITENRYTFSEEAKKFLQLIVNIIIKK